MISRLLIANRGEIAVRVIRACAEMGVRSIAVYSKADRNALHVKKADEAFSVGDDPLAGYLDAHKIANLAVERKCDAIHPGYGFLSENPLLAKLCRRLGVRFVGPPAEVIAQMGDKVAARKAMQKAGVPVVPGSDGPAHGPEEAAQVAAEIGYPVMLKAVAGGGGRGIRACENERETRRNFARVASEAGKAFGNPSVFVEKRMKNPRHIEVQILADDYGGAIHLFERDCSIQRRNQKLIEIAPSPQLSAAQREKICDAAVRAARAVDYRNAGTVEFLMDEEGDFHFLEMNTRLQVEHPVSEQITGVDIVQEQIRIASGHPLSISQADVGFRGYAMELRVNAEDPQNGFAPSFGRVTRYYAPGGPGVRTDGAIYTGYVIPPYYDSLCAKLIVWALTWPGVVERGRRALGDMRVAGVKTTAPYYRQILSHEDFRAGRFNTGFVESHPELLRYPAERPRGDLVLALAAAVVARGQFAAAERGS